jgi:hypothetical protein
MNYVYAPSHGVVVGVSIDQQWEPSRTATPGLLPVTFGDGSGTGTGGTLLGDPFHHDGEALPESEPRHMDIILIRTGRRLGPCYGRWNVSTTVPSETRCEV